MQEQCCLPRIILRKIHIDVDTTTFWHHMPTGGMLYTAFQTTFYLTVWTKIRFDECFLPIASTISLTDNPRELHDIITTSYWRRRDVIPSHRCQYYVITTSCVCRKMDLILDLDYLAQNLPAIGIVKKTYTVNAGSASIKWVLHSLLCAYIIMPILSHKRWK